MMTSETSEQGISIEELQRSLQADLEETEKALREVTLMLDQSRVEVGKLTQRNASITAHLQQVQSGSATLQELRNAYDSALDAQQRLFVMRGQLDKLQGDQANLNRTKATLLKALEALSRLDGSTAKQPGQAKPGGIEMVINAQESERQRLSRLMHDGPAQALSNFILQAEIAQRLFDVDASQARNELGNLKAAALSTLQKVRNFIFELRPMMLDDLGLLPTTKRYLETFKEQTGMEVTLSITGSERRVEPFVEVMVFRSLQELLGNASRHSAATLTKVHLDMGENLLKVSVDDNGKGFDPEVLKQANNLGLRLIQDRVEMLGGTFSIESVTGKGTRVTFSVPIAKPAGSVAE